MQKEKEENEVEEACLTDTKIYVIDGTKCIVTSEFHDKVNVAKTVYELAVQKAIELAKETEKSF